MKRTVSNGEQFALPWGTMVLFAVDGKEVQCTTKRRMLVTPVASGEISVPTRRGQILVKLLAVAGIVAITAVIVFGLQSLVVTEDGTNAMEACTAMGGDEIRLERKADGERRFTCIRTTEIGPVD